MTTEKNELERNVEYVVKVVERDGSEYGISRWDLIPRVRIEHSKENSLGIPETKEAITEAEKRGLIRKLDERYFLNK